MASLIHFYLIIFIFTGCLCPYTEALERKYISLTSDIHKYYKTSSVFFIFAQLDRRLEEYTVVQLLSREFSQRGIMTLISNFRQLGQRVTSYKKRISRPLIVIVLKGKKDVDAFNRNTHTMNKSYPIWLIIFDAEPGDSLCKYCINPVANIFGIRFDTEMLVMCCEDPVLREWWSNSDNHTEIAAFARWTEEEGLHMLTMEGLYARRNNVNGTGLRIAIVPNFSNLVVDHGNNMVGGFFGEILQELNRRMNFTITATFRATRFGSWSEANQNWSGVVGQLVKGSADFGVAEFTMTSRRLDVIDFTLPFLTTKSQLFIRKPDGSRVKWSAYFEAFTVGIWLMILLIIITTPLLLAVIQVKESTVPLSSVIFQNYLYVWGIFCQQGLCEFPTETPLRIAYFSIFILALVVSSCYSASLTSYLAVSSATLPFTDFLGFVRDGSYKLIVYKGSSDYDFFATSTDPFFRKMMTFMKPWAELPGSTMEGWDQVCRERVALFTNQAIKEITATRIKCEISGIDTGRLDSLAMTMTASNQYTDVVNYHIQRFHDNGMLNRLKQKHFGKHSRVKTTYDVVSLSGIAPILSVFGCGIILAFVLLFCEQIHCACLKNNAGMWRTSINSRKIMLLRWVNFSEKKELTRQNLRPPVQFQTDLYNNAHYGYYN